MDSRLLLIEEAKEHLPSGLLIDLDTGKDIAQIKEGVLLTDDANRLAGGIWLAGSRDSLGPRVVRLDGKRHESAAALIGAEVTAFLTSQRGLLLVGTTDGRLFELRPGNDPPVVIGEISEGPITAITETVDGHIIATSATTVSFMPSGHQQSPAAAYPGAIGDISADGTLTAIVAENSLSIVETSSGAIAWTVQKGFDRVLFNCEGSSIFCAVGLKSRWKTLEEYDALAGLPLDPSGSRDFHEMLTNSPAVRFGDDEYITASSQQSSFDWLAGNTDSGQYCFRGSPGSDVIRLGWKSLCFSGRSAKTSVLVESGKALLSLPNSATVEVPLPHLRNLGDVHVLFGPNDTEVLMATIQGAVRCFNASTGELMWQKTHPLQFAAEDTALIPSRAATSVLLVDGHLNVLDHELKRLKTFAVLPQSLSYAELSSDSQTLLTLSLDGVVGLWSVKEGRQIAELKGQERVCLTKFSACGKFFVAADAEGEVSLHRSDTGSPVWQVSTYQRGIQSIIPWPEKSAFRILVNGHVETWHVDEPENVSPTSSRINCGISVNGWPLRFISDLANKTGLDQRALASLSSNSAALDDMRPLYFKDALGRPITLHVPVGPLRTLHRWLRPPLEELRTLELERHSLPEWRNAINALSAHSSGSATLLLKIDSYAETLLFGRLFAWMTNGPLQMGSDAATLLSRILTRSDHMAISSRSTALLGELITIDLTERLVRLGNREGVMITRFADRLFISGESIPAAIASVLKTGDGKIAIPGRLLSETVSRSGFRLEPYGLVEDQMSEIASA